MRGEGELAETGCHGHSWLLLGCVACCEAGRLYIAARITGQCVATRAVATTAGGLQDDKQQDYDYHNDPKHLRPTRRASSRSAIGFYVGVVVGLRVRGPVSHVCLFVRGCQGFVHNSDSLSRQYVAAYSYCIKIVVMYTWVMPKLWNETIEAHRRAVRDAILAATVALVDERGLASVTMSQIAEKTGIGRATLYKYFPDVEAILVAWHDRQITDHLEYLTEVRDQTNSDAGKRLEAVLEAYALISYKSRRHHDTELVALLHRDERVAQAQQQLHGMIGDLLTEAAETGELRGDVAPQELASYCLHALTAASTLPSEAAVRRLVAVTLTGLHARS